MPRRTSDPEHPILPESSKYDVVGFQWDRTGDEPHALLVLQHSETSEVRRLRFLGVKDVVFHDAGFTSGLTIFDVRGRQLEGIGVHVYNIENSPDQVTLWARDVEDVTNRDEGAMGRADTSPQENP